MPPDPLEPFLFLNQLQIFSAEKKNAPEKCGNYAPPPFKIYRYATESKCIFSAFSADNFCFYRVIVLSTTLSKQWFRRKSLRVRPFLRLAKNGHVYSELDSRFVNVESLRLCGPINTMVLSIILFHNRGAKFGFLILVPYKDHQEQI